MLTANLTAIAAFGYTPADRYLLALPLFHITALGTALAHMHAGGASVVVSRYDAEEAVRLIDRHRVTHLSDFPPVLATLLDAAEKLGSRLPSLRDVAGLDAPPTIERLHAKTGAAFWTGFGQSETSGFVCLQRVKDKPGAAGRPVPAAQVKLVDDYDRDVPVGTPGEIVVRGPLVFQGYFAQPEVTAPHVPQRLASHGRRGAFDDEGYLYYVRRKPEKELIKPGGENVYPAEVETVIVQMEGVTGACVFGIPDFTVGDAEHAGAGHAVHLHDDRLHLGRVHVLAAGLDELLLRLALDVVEVALGVEAADVARVVPAVAEGVRRHVGLGEVALEHERAAHHDLARRADRHLAVVVVDEPHCAAGTGRPAAPGLSITRWMLTKPLVSDWPKPVQNCAAVSRAVAGWSAARRGRTRARRLGSRLPSFSAASRSVASTGGKSERWVMR